MFDSKRGRRARLAVLITDGEDFSRNLATVQKEAQKKGIALSVLGVGTPEGAPVPILNAQGEVSGHEIDAQGKVVATSLNETILREIGSALGGLYIRVTGDNSDVRSIAQYVERYEQELFDEKMQSGCEERYPLFVAAAFICFLLEWVL